MKPANGARWDEVQLPGHSKMNHQVAPRLKLNQQPFSMPPELANDLPVERRFQ
jgi:hypothetical protein